ncbi:kinase-like domain-containing protein [Cladochytrium replicatum]|nr:kinase-like domain-containing protein [Cladochytrium replicatum]
MSQPLSAPASSATQNSSAPIPVPITSAAQQINVPTSSGQFMAPAPISSSPPRSIISLRKASLVERTSAAIEAKLSGAGVPLRRGSSSATAQFSPQMLSQNGEQYPMHPDAYELGIAIGYGSSATVYIAKCLPMNKNVAIKMIDLDMFERNQIDELRREIQIMSLSKHQNLLPVHGSFVSGSKLYIVTPFLSAGSCLDIMKTAHPEGLEEVAVSTILKQALQGLEYLHKNGLIHRDVKAGNLLMDDDGLVQLADFGVSSSLDTGERKGMRKTFVGTPCWMAPEVMEQSGYDLKADIWSFGITALELATGHAPFAKYPPIKVLMLTLQNDPPTLDRDTTKHRYSKGFKEMIDSCLQKDPSKRPTAEKLLQHPYFKQAKKNQYLVQVLLKGLPSITSRPHNRREFES